MRRRLLFTSKKEGISGVNAVAGDVCLYNKTTEELCIITKSDFNISNYPLSKYSPVGVVVVPGAHDIYGTGECSCIALKWLKCTDFSDNEINNGSTSSQSMYFGGYGVDITTINNYNKLCHVGSYGSIKSTSQGLCEEGYISSDKFTNTKNPYDSDTYYNDIGGNQLPSPYNNDDSRNKVYYQTSSPSSTSNGLSDFYGKENCEKILKLATAQSDWKTASTITNHSGNGYYAPVCCSWRYRTYGTSQGDWYIPAIGELGYIMPKYNNINNSLKTLMSYGSSYSCELSTSLASSTEYNEYNIRVIDLSNGNITYVTKNGYCYPRAFLRLT